MSSPAATAASSSSSSTPNEKRTRVVVALPGNSFSQAFLMAWTETLNALSGSGRYEVMVSTGKSSFVPFTRMQTLGLDVLRGKKQKPFNGQAYDVYVTIDSDIVYSAAQVMELIECTKVHPVVSGYYMMADNKHFAVVKDWDKEYFLKNGSFPFLTTKDLEPYVERIRKQIEERKADEEAQKESEEKKDLKPIIPEFIKVSYTGLGFFACRKEVLDDLQYPYFNRDLQRMRSKDGLEIVDMCSEDVAFCKNIEDAGYDIMLHTSLRVGHEKAVVL
jgi:hypothetical protein